MAPEPDVIRQDIEETRTALTEKLETLETQVRATVQDAKDSVTDTIEAVKGTVEDTIASVKSGVHDTVESMKESIDVSHHVQEHPFLMMGCSLAAGFATGYLLAGRDRWPDRYAYDHGPRTNGQASAAPPLYEAPARQAPPAPSFLSSLLSRFDSEIDQVKGMAIGAAMGVVRDLIKQAVPPTLAPQVADVLNSATTKLGGQPVRGPILDTESTSGRV